MAGGPRRPPSPGGAGADDVAPRGSDGHGSRDDKYKVSSEGIKESRKEMAEPLRVNTNADYWRLHGKGFAVDVVQTDMQAPALGCL